jgi:hypothetical protein
MLKWYLPSFYGDIRLESTGKESTKVTVFGLTNQEKVAMTALLLEAEKARVVGPCWNPKASRLLDLDSIQEQSLDLLAPISKVQKLLQKKLKPGRDQVSVVRFGGGKIQEMTERHLELTESDSSKSSRTVNEPSETQKSTSTPATGADDAAAVTVARPVRGCPAPDFEQAEVRAAAVMCAFLTNEQISDFKSDQASISVGADTGHRYIITSRHARTRLAMHTRSLYDLDEKRPYCVHDWEVPAAEEMLAIHVFLTIPGLETYMRAIPHEG